MEALATETGETMHLAVWRDDHTPFVDQIIGTHRLRAVSTIGERFPMTTTANGKAALGLLDDELVDAIASRELGAGAEGKRPARRLRTEIDRIREAGFGLDLDEHTEGISAVEAAFRAPSGLVYAIAIPVPSQRFARRRGTLTEDRLAALERVRSALGGDGSGRSRLRRTRALGGPGGRTR